MQNPQPEPSLIEHFQVLPDPQVERTKHHDLIDILVIAVSTLICGVELRNAGGMNLRQAAAPWRAQLGGGPFGQPLGAAGMRASAVRSLPT
jgi:hypothetical protein